MVRFRLSACSALLVSVVLAACSGVTRTETPAISVSPTSINLPPVAVGQSAATVITVRNSGGADLVLTNPIVDATTGFLTIATPFPVTVVPDGEAFLSFTYAPADPSLTTGEVRFDTNDPDSGTVRLDIVAAQPTPLPAIFPGILDFGLVAEESDSTLSVGIRSIGTAPLILCDVRTAGSPDITDDATDAIAAQLDAELGYVVLEPAVTGEAVDELLLTIRYQPSSPGADTSELVIEYDADGFRQGACTDGETETTTYPINGEAGAPTLSVSPNPVNFGETPIAFAKREAVTLTNVGDLPLVISAIALDPARNSGDFALEDIPNLPVTLGADESILVTAVYEPGELGTDAAVMVVTHSDAGADPAETDVTFAGAGVEDRCPVPVARAYVLEDPENRVSDEISWGVPLQTLILDGRESFDPDGPVVDWEWSIVEAPSDAVFGLAPYAPPGIEETPALRQYLIPLAGRYEFELRVYDEVGATCDAARVVLVATPQEAITIELVWNNPDDPTEEDTEGSDVDVHFVKMPNPWFHPTFDTYFSNPEPSWSPELPSLDIDDTDGAGPETVQLNNPVDGQCYALGVHYFRERFGTAYPTVRIYFEGRQIDEIYGELRETDDFWDVVRIHWPSRTVYRIDELIENFDSDDRLVPGVTDEMIRNDHCVGIGGT
jgi:hypothetical protein